MKRLIVFFIFFSWSVAAVLASDFWEGNATTARFGEFADEGMIAASNSFAPNTTLEVVNIASGESVRVRVVGRVSEPGVFLVLSRDAARAIGLDSRILTQVRAAIVPEAALTDASPSEDVPFHLDPDINPAARLGDPNLALIPSRPEPAPSVAEPPAVEPLREQIVEQPIPDDPVVVEQPPLEAVVEDDAPLIAVDDDVDDVDGVEDAEPSISVARVEPVREADAVPAERPDRVPEPDIAVPDTAIRVEPAEPDVPDAVISAVPDIPRVSESLGTVEPRVSELPRVTVAPGEPTVVAAPPAETPDQETPDHESVIERAAAELAARTPERRVLVESRDDAVTVIDRADAPRTDRVPVDRLAVADPQLAAPEPTVARPEPTDAPETPALAAARVDRPSVERAPEPAVAEPELEPEHETVVAEEPVDDTPEPGLPIVGTPELEPLVVELPVARDPPTVETIAEPADEPAAEPDESEQPRIVNGIVPPVPPDSTLVLEPAELRPPRAPLDELDASIGRTEPIDPEDPALAAFPPAPAGVEHGVVAAEPDPGDPADRRPAPAAPEPPSVMPDPVRPTEPDSPAVAVRPDPPREPVRRVDERTPDPQPRETEPRPAEPGPRVVADESVETLDRLVSEAYYVQIGAYNNSSAAEQALAEIARNLPSTILVTRGPEREVYRAFAGPFERDETGTALNLIRSRGVRDAFVRRGADVVMR